MGFVRSTLFFTFLLIFTCGHASEPSEQTFESEQFPNVKIIRVIDGSTIVLYFNGKETTLRLIGEDTPVTI